MIPNLFKKEPIPKKIPLEMQKVVKKLKKCKSKEECLKLAYGVMTKRYRGYRFTTYLRLGEIFENDVNKLWARRGFLHCNLMNFLLRVLLVKSGWFKEKDIEQNHCLVWYISLHQYLRVAVGGGKKINVDLWNASYGKKFGQYAHGFS